MEKFTSPIYVPGHKFIFQPIWQMAYNENVQLAFSLDQKETYIASWLYKKAEEYTNLFRYKREALIIAWKYWIENNVFDKAKYKEILESRGIVYATEYKKFFQLKKEILRIKDFLGFTKELWDEDVVIDDELKKEDDDEIQAPISNEQKTEENAHNEETWAENEESTEDDIETLRQKYFEKFGKAVATGYKNNIEWIKKKIL